MTLSRRRTRHYADMNDSTCHFHNALRKYKKSDWKWEVLFYCEQADVSDYEIKVIALHDTYNNGYNSTTGGERGYKVSDETRQRLSDAHIGQTPWNKGLKGQGLGNKNGLGFKHTDEARAKISAAGRRPCSEETKRKIGLANKKRAAERRLLHGQAFARD